MRKLTFIFPLFLAALILLVASCGSNRSFSSRKYTAGNYIAHKHKPGQVSVHENPGRESAPVSKGEAVAGKASAAEKTDLPKEGLASDHATALGMTAEESKAASENTTTEKKTEVQQKETKAPAFKAERLKKYIADRTERKTLAYDDGDNALDPVALVSFILGIIGLVLNILALSVIVATSEYVFMLLFIAGLVMGIIALVFGTQGLRRYHENKSGTINLVFSIIGTVFGAGAIITAFGFAFYSFILFLEGL